MLDALYRLPDLYIFLILVAITISLSLFSIWLSRRYIFHKLKASDNTTISSVSSLIGIIYGVLVGFCALYLLNNNSEASNAVLSEANALTNISRFADWLKEPAKAEINAQIKVYINHTVQDEWPAMRQGKDVDHQGDVTIGKIAEILKNYPLSSQSEILAMRQLLEEVHNLYNGRQERLSMSGSQLSPELWEVILIGTILIIGINYAFHVSYYLHLFAITSFAIMAASLLFVLVTLDRPFQGEFIVDSTPLSAVLSSMEASH